MGCLTEKVRQPILIFLYPSNVSRVSSSGGFLSFALGEDDLIDHEEHHHGDAAVEDCGADVIQPAGNEVSGYGHPDQLMELTTQVTMQKAMTYHMPCQAILPLLRNTQPRWMKKLMTSPMTMAIM